MLDSGYIAKITLLLDGLLYHGVVIYGEDTYCKKVVFYLSALKPNVVVASKAPRGRYDFDKP